MDVKMKLVRFFKEHDFDRLECQDHEHLCDVAGCHDLKVSQYEHYADELEKKFPTEKEIAVQLQARYGCFRNTDLMRGIYVHNCYEHPGMHTDDRDVFCGEMKKLARGIYELWEKKL